MSTQKPFRRGALTDEECTPIAAEPVTMLDRLLSVGLWAVGSAWLVAGVGGMMAAMRIWRADQIERFAHLYARGQVYCTGSKWRRVVHPKVDSAKQYFFLQNHINHFDFCSMYDATPHFKQGVELADHFKYPVYGPFMKRRGTIPILKNSRHTYENLCRDVRSELALGHSILAFPEGTRTQTGRVGKFKPGMFKVAIETGTPIVPVTVTGMYDVMRKGSLLIRPGYTVTVYCDEPIETVGLTEADVPMLMKKTRDVIAKRVDDYYRERGKL